MNFFINQMIATDNYSGLVGMYDIEDRSTLPFVTKAVAEIMLCIGIALEYIRGRQSSTTIGCWKTLTPDLSLIPSCPAHLSSLQCSLHSPSFSAAIAAIRPLNSRNALQMLLSFRRCCRCCLFKENSSSRAW